MVRIVVRDGILERGRYLKSPALEEVLGSLGVVARLNGAVGVSVPLDGRLKHRIVGELREVDLRVETQGVG